MIPIIWGEILSRKSSGEEIQNLYRPSFTEREKERTNENHPAFTQSIQSMADPCPVVS